MQGTSNNSFFSRVAVDPGQTSLEEGREFRLIRKIEQNIGVVYWKFTSAVDFILFKESLAVSEGDIELTVYRAADVTDGGGWGASLPTFGKNISNEYREYDGQRYQTQVTIQTGGTVTVNNADNYADYIRARTSNATSQQTTVGTVMDDKRYLAAGSYYFVMTALLDAAATFELAWEERP